MILRSRLVNPVFANATGSKGMQIHRAATRIILSCEDRQDAASISCACYGRSCNKRGFCLRKESLFKKGFKSL